MSDTSSFGYGQIQPDDGATDLNAIAAVVRQLVARLNVMKWVKVVAVHPGSGSPPAAGTVDVLPLVSQIDANGYAVPHGTVFGLPYLRLQAGPWAIVADPAVGDVGIIVCGDRDSSSVPANPGQTVTPGSRRRHDIADGVYIGGGYNAVPAATLWLKGDGTFEVQDQPGNVLQSSAQGLTYTPPAGGAFIVNGDIVGKGALKLAGAIEAPDGTEYQPGIVTAGEVTAKGVNLSTHKHAQPNDSHGDVEQPTAAPTPGT